MGLEDVHGGGKIRAPQDAPVGEGEGMPMPIERDDVAMAARRGNLKLLQWLREEGCPWNQWTCAMAAEKG
eukprot:CAMPEP_0194322656 /NCGR_PEP_ID=MMETSP0171-20130528/22196_1 /TAXON_ID=218684 /ORGANISM="Corethron pennatum, Strain L29A3" /LENGTH=69 /DNA_ID=CAMNT_0039081007 /DNA_START=489 /DNA_END=695 /DNA_ORIENTATION=+